MVHHPFLQGNDCVIGDLNTLRTNFGAAFGNITITDALSISQFVQSIFGIERMHLERRDMNQKTRPDEFIVQLMIAQHVANVLAEKTLDAFSKLLDAIDVGLLHSPGAVWRIRRTWSEWFNFPLRQEIPRYVVDQVLDDGKGLHRFDANRFIDR